MEGFWTDAYSPLEKDIGAEQKEKGKNVEIDICLVRHAQRPHDRIDPGVDLTEKGKQECIKLGNQFKRSIVGGESSPTKRTKQTAQITTFNTHNEDKRPIKENENLASHSSERFRNEIREYVKKKLKEENPNLTKDELKNIDLLSNVYGIDYYLNYLGEFDRETYSPVQTAANVALQIDRVIRKETAGMKSDTAMDYLMATHDYLIAAFLQQVLRWKQEDGTIKLGFTSLKELGDTPIEFLETLKIIARTDDKGQLIIKNENGTRTLPAEFRGQPCEIDLDCLEELIAQGKQMKFAK